ncbi:2-oxoacid:acceptor oxidoreductase family protein [bacterium]|nr:2-oxoacid:acceptor oxidoreductase family protein [bacterium]MBU1984256.1 2-oxoacid:acceptor oxidoreductase family protein [bacterium]
MDARVRITGFGGQGVIMAGYILGQAASVHDDRHAIFTQSYGPEARGSACSAQIVISDLPILNPFIKQQDVLCAMSQEGFDKFVNSMAKDGIVLIDEDLVDLSGLPPDFESRYPIYRIPATRLAEKEIGKRIVTNIMMLGFLASVTGVVTKGAIQTAVANVAPRGTEKLNADALNFGLAFEIPAKKTESKPKPKSKPKAAEAKDQTK